MTDERNPPPNESQPATDTAPRRRPMPAERETSAPASRRHWTGPAAAVGLAMGAGAIATLVLTGMKDQALYSKPVDELLAQRAKFIGRPVRAEGNLVHGSLTKRDQPCEYRFTIAKNATEMPVRFAQCVVPDTFRDVPDIDVGVTVEGELSSDGSFEATNVLAKCPSKYEMEQRKNRGEGMPHGPLAMDPGMKSDRSALR
ncbi:MAG: cytochrome c maturation protein CcmE [Polyangiaceae bacterium]|nr:cytochrome c maturation protein CcmE [Polyangiaceae bacterium]